MENALFRKSFFDCTNRTAVSSTTVCTFILNVVFQLPDHHSGVSINLPGPLKVYELHIWYV